MRSDRPKRPGSATAIAVIERESDSPHALAQASHPRARGNHGPAVLAVAAAVTDEGGRVVEIDR